MKLIVHGRGWVGSSARKEGEQGEVLIGAVVEIDGHVLDPVTSVEVISKPDEFTKVVIELVPAEIEYVSHTEASWKELFVPRWLKRLAEEKNE